MPVGIDTAPVHNSELMLDGNGNLYNPNASISSGSETFDQGFDNWFNWLLEKAKNGNQDAIDRVLNYYLTEKSNDTARKYQSEREDTRYQRMFEDLRKAGINPAILFMNGGGSAGSVNGTSGSSYNSSGFGQSLRNSADNANDTQNALLRSIISFVGTALMVMASL